MKTRRIQHIRADGFERLQTLDRVLEIRASPQKVFTAGRQNEIMRQAARGLDGRLDSLNRKIKLENRIIPAVGVIFDGTAHEAGFGGRANGIRDAQR